MKNSVKFILFFLVLFGSARIYSVEPSAQDIAREKLLMAFSGEWISRGLYVATKLEVADNLQTGAKTIEYLAKLSSSDPDCLQRILHMLAGIGIFEEVAPGIFANTDTSRLLIKTNPDSLYSLSLFYGEDIHQSWDELLASVQTGEPAFKLKFKQPVFSYFKSNPEHAELFQKAMKEKSKSVIQSALSSYDFSECQTVYDIGGGYGQFMQALLQKYPHLNGIIFELPEVIEQIKTQGKKNMGLMAGDFFTSVPKGGDVYILKSILHDWDDARAKQILKNCCGAMHADSRLLIVEVVLQPKEQSTYANCMDVLMLAITGGKERNLESFKRMLESCGLVLGRIYPTSTEFSILEVYRK